MCIRDRVNNDAYVLVEVDNPLHEYSLTDIIERNQKVILNAKKNSLYRNEWGRLWSEKIDYLEYQVFEMGKKYPIIIKDVYKRQEQNISSYNTSYKADVSLESLTCLLYTSKSSESPLFTVIKEKNNEKQEGVLKNNFFGTNLLGPILILNPYFTKYLFSLLGYKKKLYLEKELIEAYEERVKEYQNAEIKY